MTGFLAHLEREGRELSQAVLDDMYRDPFWAERYGARGRRHADEDSDFHLQYLKRALAANDPSAMLRYATWLREVLAARGMCSRHLAENFLQLAEAIDARGWSGREVALRYLRDAAAALRYDRGVEGALEEEAEPLARELRARLTGRGTRALERGRPGTLHDELRSLLSYLADAQALGTPRLFVAHMQWLSGHITRRGVDSRGLGEALGLLEEAVAARPACAAAAPIVRAGRDALAPNPAEAPT